MKTKCPHCNTVQKAPDEAAGREALCRSCREKFTITEYAPPVIVPIADLPDPDDIPITVDAPPPKDRSGNILSRAWLGIPGPFKTSFLATLGVVSALLFAWYVVRVPKWFNKPSIPPAPEYSSLPPIRKQTSPATAPATASALFVRQCAEDYHDLWSVQAAGSVAGRTLDASQFLGWAKSTLPTLRQISSRITQRQPPSDRQLETVHSALQRAAAAEIILQVHLAGYVGAQTKPDGVYVGKLWNEAVDAGNHAIDLITIQQLRFSLLE